MDLDAAVLLRVLDLRFRWIVSCWDAMILAAAERSACPTLYAEDLSDGHSYGDVRVVNPFLANIPRIEETWEMGKSLRGRPNA